MLNKRISIAGTVGVPANYGGFETLVENLLRFKSAHRCHCEINVYCSSKSYAIKKEQFLGAKLKYIPLSANGKQSIIYDAWALLNAILLKSDVILLLGVSGAIALPVIRLFSNVRIVTNIDGIEWKREKWQGLAKRFLRFSERLAINYSDEVISDNEAIEKYIKDEYGVACHVIAYGGDHALVSESSAKVEFKMPDDFCFSVCRIEPENNVHLILEAFSKLPGSPLVFVGNWGNSEYGRDLRAKYKSCTHIKMLDPIYDSGQLAALRGKARFYLHGHSAGGTNPSLVEAMHFGRPIVAYDCDFNRFTTEGKALFFKTSEDLISLIENINEIKNESIGKEMKEIAERRYTWGVIAKQYFDLMES